MKKRSLIATTFLFTVLSSFTAFAGQWKLDSKGWWWDNGDGTYPVATWQWIDANNDHVAECYCFGPDGYLLTNTTTPDGYSVSADGQWLSENGEYMVKVIVPEDSPLALKPGTYETTYSTSYKNYQGTNHVESYYPEIDTDYGSFKITDDGNHLQFLVYDGVHSGTLIDRKNGCYEVTDYMGMDGDSMERAIYVISDDTIIVQGRYDESCLEGLERVDEEVENTNWFEILKKV